MNVAGMLRSARATDWAEVRLSGPLRTGMVAVVVLLLLTAGGYRQAVVPTGVGLLWGTLADPGGPYLDRARVVGVATACLALSACLGVLVAHVFVTHLVVLAVVAAICAMAAAGGARSGLVGVLSLVCFSVFAGSSSME